MQVKKAAEILKPYSDLKEYLPFKLLQGVPLLLSEWEVDPDNKIMVEFTDQKKDKYSYNIEKEKLENWLSENMPIPVEVEQKHTYDAKVETSVEQNISDMRTVLSGVISDLRNGKIDVVNARTVAQITQTWLNSFSIEVNYQKHLNIKQPIKQLEK